MSRELWDRYREYEQKLARLEEQQDQPRMQQRIDEINALSHAPDFWNDQANAQKLTRERDELQQGLDDLKRVRELLADARAGLELAEEGADADLLREVALPLDDAKTQIEELEFARMLSGEYDANNAILTINAGAGGTESCDWAAMLLRMYLRWADAHGYAHEVVDFTEGDGAGYRSATVTITGRNAYGWLKAENGVHRLVRISPFDANKRRHTSFCSVFVYPEVDDSIEIDIKTEDLKIDTFRAGGAGGQHVNKTDSAVRFTHIPTGTVVVCRSERSQHQNRQLAMKLLRAKLFELEMKKREAERDDQEKQKKRIEWGSQIRSYVLQPYQMAKDHRTDFEVGDVSRVLDGDLDGFMRAFLMGETTSSSCYR